MTISGKNFPTEQELGLNWKKISLVGNTDLERGNGIKAGKKAR